MARIPRLVLDQQVATRKSASHHPPYAVHAVGADLPPSLHSAAPKEPTTTSYCLHSCSSLAAERGTNLWCQSASNNAMNSSIFAFACISCPSEDQGGHLRRCYNIRWQGSDKPTKLHKRSQESSVGYSVNLSSLTPLYPGSLTRTSCLPIIKRLQRLQNPPPPRTPPCRHSENTSTRLFVRTGSDESFITQKISRDG